MSDAAKKGYSQIYLRVKALGLDKAETPERNVREAIIDQAADEKYRPLVEAAKAGLEYVERASCGLGQQVQAACLVVKLREALRKVKEG